MSYLGTVAWIFNISGRGVVVVPAEPWAAEFRVGDSLRLQTPRGDMVSVIVKGFEMIHRHNAQGANGILLVGLNRTEVDIPLGSRLFTEVRGATGSAE